MDSKEEDDTSRLVTIAPVDDEGPVTPGSNNQALPQEHPLRGEQPKIQHDDAKDHQSTPPIDTTESKQEGKKQKPTPLDITTDGRKVETEDVSGVLGRKVPQEVRRKVLEETVPQEVCPGAPGMDTQEDRRSRVMNASDSELVAEDGCPPSRSSPGEVTRQNNEGLLERLALAQAVEASIEDQQTSAKKAEGRPPRIENEDSVSLTSLLNSAPNSVPQRRSSEASAARQARAREPNRAQTVPTAKSRRSKVSEDEWRLGQRESSIRQLVKAEIDYRCAKAERGEKAGLHISPLTEHDIFKAAFGPLTVAEKRRILEESVAQSEAMLVRIEAKRRKAEKRDSKADGSLESKMAEKVKREKRRKASKLRATREKVSRKKAEKLEARRRKSRARNLRVSTSDSDSRSESSFSEGSSEGKYSPKVHGNRASRSKSEHPGLSSESSDSTTFKRAGPLSDLVDILATPSPNSKLLAKKSSHVFPERPRRRSHSEWVDPSVQSSSSFTDSSGDDSGPEEDFKGKRTKQPKKGMGAPLFRGKAGKMLKLAKVNQRLQVANSLLMSQAKMCQSTIDLPLVGARTSESQCRLEEVNALIEALNFYSKQMHDDYRLKLEREQTTPSLHKTKTSRPHFHSPLKDIKRNNPDPEPDPVK